MQQKIVASSFVAAFLLNIASPFEASGQILATSNLEQVCKTAPAITHRRTLVYVDLAAIHKEKTEWGLTILNRLELAQREWLTILSVNPNTFEINQVFDTCYPSLTKTEIDQRRTERDWWTRLTSLDPEDQQRENLQAFDTRLRNSLDKIITDASKFQKGKRQNILGAIAFDKNRFNLKDAWHRIVVYTDGILVEPDLDGVTESTRQLDFLLSKYPANFSGSEVYFFGLADNAESAGPRRIKEEVISGFFLGSWAHLKSFASSLPQQKNRIAPPLLRRDGKYSGGGTQGEAKLTFLSTGSSIDAELWISFVVGRVQLFVPFDEAKMSCKDDQCEINATCAESIPALSSDPYFRKGDKLLLKGKKEAKFIGALTAAGRETFKDDDKKVEYTFEFSPP